MVKTYCSNCSKKCIGDVLKVGDKYFHQKCFKCKDCNSYLDTGGFYVRNGNYYCQKDYTTRFSNKCFICSNIIESEVVSALNNHFHRNCFKCSTCSKTFAPGDRVTKKGDTFICNKCSSNNPINIEISKSTHTNEQGLCDSFVKKDLLSDDAMTDQGYDSADPTSANLQKHKKYEKVKSGISSPNPVSKKSNSRSSLSHSLFEFGKFYRSSYLDIKESQEKERLSQSKKSSSHASKYQSLSNFHLPNSRNRYLKSRNNETLSMRSAIDCAINSSLQKMNQDNKFDLSEKENVIRLSSYPSGEKPSINFPVPLERDDWPAPLSTAILLHEKMIRQRDNFETASAINVRSISGDESVDCTQSLEYLSCESSDRHQRNLTEILIDGQKNKRKKTDEDDVISASRSPNASTAPTPKTRFSNHRDNSKSRDATYFNDTNRHNGYSLEYVSSTTRPFMAGEIPKELKPGYTQGLLFNAKSVTSRDSRTVTSNNSNTGVNDFNYIWTAVRTMSDTFDVQLKNIEYDSTVEEPLFDNQDGQSSLDVNVITGLKMIKTRSWKDRVKDLNLTSDRSSISSKIESLEALSYWSHKPVVGCKNVNVAYDDILSKDPKIMKGLDMDRLETYLSTEEFFKTFNLNRTEFYRLPEWKRNDLKRRVQLF